MLQHLKLIFIAVVVATAIFISVTALFVYSPIIVPIVLAPGHRADLAEMLGVHVYIVNILFVLSIVITAMIHWGVYVLFRMISIRSMDGLAYLIFRYIDKYGVENARKNFEECIEGGRQMYERLGKE